jgi:predicted dehydrogenase
MKKIWVLFLGLVVAPMAGDAVEPIRIGLIGLDTSHAPAFTQILDDSEHPQHVPGAKVVAAFKGGSDDLPASYTRVDGFTEQLEQRFGVRIVATIEELCAEVDAILLTSVDGRKHLEQARPVIAAGIPLYIDKPMAASLADVIEIFRLAEEANVPVFSTSSYRYYPGLLELKNRDIGELRGAISYGPAQMDPTHPDLAWYGIHPIEALFTVMGTGLESVVRVHTPDTDVVTGVWSGGKVGTLRGIRNGSAPNRVIVFGSKGVAEQGPGAGYRGLMVEAVEFFRSGEPPVSARETIEIFAFIEAADESRRLGGVPVEIAALLARHGYVRDDGER